MSKNKKIILWIISILLMLVVAYFQRVTGPTYPVKGEIKVKGINIQYSLPRSHSTTNDCLIPILVPDSSIQGYYYYRRYKSYDTITTKELIRKADTLFAVIPKQPPAGKVEYGIVLTDEKNQNYYLSKDNIIIRFKGDVPLVFLIFHILFVFCAMVISTRTGLEALFKGANTYKYTLATLITLIIGGFILGPIIQYYAFGAFWTGFPFGKDLTDNKTLISFIWWLVAFLLYRKNRENYGWIISASIVLIITFLIPHSLLGSELDYTKMENQP